MRANEVWYVCIDCGRYYKKYTIVMFGYEYTAMTKQCCICFQNSTMRDAIKLRNNPHNPTIVTSSMTWELEHDGFLEGIQKLPIEKEYHDSEALLDTSYWNELE